MTCSVDLNTLPKLFLNQTERYQNRRALLYKHPRTKKYISHSWLEWEQYVKNTALGLWSLGVRAGDNVAILSENRPEWTFSDLGVLCLGAANVPIYPTSSASDIEYILSNAEVNIIILSCRDQLNKILEINNKRKLIKKIIIFDSVPLDDPLISDFESLLLQGALINLNNPDLFNQQVSNIRSEDLATIIYTSGTTGAPKGVMLSHNNFIENFRGSNEYIKVCPNDVSLSFLPLSHVFERLAGYYFMIGNGATIAYAENIQTVAEDMLQVRPSVAACVPRFYEKIYNQICANVEIASTTKQKLFSWAVLVGGQVSRLRLSKKSIPLLLSVMYKVASILVFKKIKRKLGGRIKFFISGGAPLPKALGEFFYSADITILEGYGLTETSPVMAVNSLSKMKFGTVGQILPNVEVKICPDGEIATKGPCVMKGYFKNPDATNEAIKDGWFYTGDIGEIDEEGFLKITDRKKDIIVTSGGKNIAPQNLENTVQQCKLVNQCVVVGDKRNYIVALIVPNKEEIVRYASSKGYPCENYDDLIKNKDIRDWVKDAIDTVTKDLPSYQQIKYIALLKDELTQAAGDLTPTLKVKRKVVVNKYSQEIENLYSEGQSYKN